MKNINLALRRVLKQSDFIVNIHDRLVDSVMFKGLSRKYQSIQLVRKEHIKKAYRSAMSIKAEHFTDNSLADFPKFGGIEVNTSCNLNCPMCNTSLSNRVNERMELELFEQLVLLKKYHGIRKTVIHTIGEPLMNNHLDDYLMILKKHGMKLILITNGQLVKQRFETLKKYLDTLSYIGISIDGAYKESYENLRPPGNFDILLENLEKLKDLDVEKRIYSTVSGQVKSEIAYHLEFYSQFVPMENISLYLLTSHSPDNEFYNSNALLGIHTQSLVPCPTLFNGHLCYLTDGKISACERDYSGELVIGDARVDKPEDVINNKKLKELRLMHLNGSIPDGHLCAECYDTDPRVKALFSLFYETLVRKYSKDWDIQAMQKRFDDFFDVFEQGFPDENQFLELLS